MSKILINNISVYKEFWFTLYNQHHLTIINTLKYFDQGSKYSFLLQYCYIVKQPGNEKINK